MHVHRPIILASSSPRRQFLMKEMGYDFTIISPDVDESFSPTLPVEQVPSYLARKKAEILRHVITTEIVVASDTVVILSGRIMNKPVDRADAFAMLSALSGETHTVVTAVCLLSNDKVVVFDDRTKVTFKKLTEQEINFYLDTFKPFDKAGAYGAQECLPAGLNPCSREELLFLKAINKLDLIDKSISGTHAGAGMVAIEKIDGSYFTVMGLPIHQVYEQLNAF